MHHSRAGTRATAYTESVPGPQLGSQRAWVGGWERSLANFNARAGAAALYSAAQSESDSCMRNYHEFLAVKMANLPSMIDQVATACIC